MLHLTVGMVVEKKLLKLDVRYINRKDVKMRNSSKEMMVRGCGSKLLQPYTDPILVNLLRDKTGMGFSTPRT